MDSKELVSAAGERAALGGYVPQFREFAWQAYRALVAGTLEWVRLADPEAQKLDDIQYATIDQLHAYQVKWTIADDVVSFADFKKLFAGLVSSWQQLRQLGRAAGKAIYLLINPFPSMMPFRPAPGLPERSRSFTNKCGFRFSWDRYMTTDGSRL